MYKDMEKKLSVWDQLKDDIKSALEKSADYLDNLAIKELKNTESYTNVTYGTFNTLVGANRKLGYDYKDCMFFVDFLKN